MKQIFLFLGFILAIQFVNAQTNDCDESYNQDSYHQRAAIFASDFRLDGKSSTELYWYCIDNGRTGGPEEDFAGKYTLLIDRPCVKVGNHPAITLKEAIYGENPVLAMHLGGWYNLTFTNLTHKKLHINLSEGVLVGDKEQDLYEVSLAGLSAAQTRQERDKIQSEFWVRQGLVRLGYLQEENRTDKNAFEQAIVGFQTDHHQSINKSGSYETENLLRSLSQDYVEMMRILHPFDRSIPTYAARINDFQQKNGLEVTGILSPNSLEKLNNLVAIEYEKENLQKLGYLPLNQKATAEQYTAALNEFKQNFNASVEEITNEVEGYQIALDEGLVFENGLDAISDFQQDQGLPLTGKWDKLSSDKLQDLVNTKRTMGILYELHYLRDEELGNTNAYEIAVNTFRKENNLSADAPIYDEAIELLQLSWQYPTLENTTAFQNEQGLAATGHINKATFEAAMKLTETQNEGEESSKAAAIVIK